MLFVREISGCLNRKFPPWGNGINPCFQKLEALGFRFKLVLADSLYGESGSNFIDVLYKLKLPFVVGIRSNHAVWLPKEQRVPCNRWREFKRIFSHRTTQQRYIREIIFGKRSATEFWEITTDPQTLPKSSTWYVMTHVPKIKYYQVGNLYGLRNWNARVSIFCCLDQLGRNNPPA
jgi:SRSO17 transposase